MLLALAGDRESISAEAAAGGQHCPGHGIKGFRNLRIEAPLVSQTGQHPSLELFVGRLELIAPVAPVDPRLPDDEVILPGNRDKVIERFAKTGGKPPQGVKMLGRWHAVANGTGVAISEADDASAMARWALEWNDLMEMEITPAMTDEVLAGVLGGLSKR